MTEQIWMNLDSFDSNNLLRDELFDTSKKARANAKPKLKQPLGTL